MKRIYIFILSAFLLLGGAGKAFAQNSGFLRKLVEKMSVSCTEVTYSYETEMSGVKIVGNHALEIQNDMWHVKGNGLEIWCDAQTLWTTDPVAKEVVIENAAFPGSGELTNPALLLLRIDDWFDIKQEKLVNDGRAVLYILSPKPEAGVNIEYLNLELLKSTGMISSGSFALEDGNAVSLTFLSMALKPKKPVSYYRPSQSFDASWILTDLR